MLQKMLVLGLAGALGTLGRHGMSVVVQKSCGTEFPLGTLAVNVVGCVLFGMVWSLAEIKYPMSPQLRMAIFVGFFGAFTTFSSFINESTMLLDDSQWIWGGCNFILQNAIGLMGLMSGKKGMMLLMGLGGS